MENTWLKMPKRTILYQKTPCFHKQTGTSNNIDIPERVQEHLASDENSAS